MSKFSSVTLIDKIIKFVYWLAHRNKDDNTPLMDFDELVGELLLEVAKGIMTYDNGERSVEEMLAILRKMCDNRVGELRHKYYSTHRASAIGVLDLQELTDGDAYPLLMTTLQENTPLALSASAIRVAETRNRLSPFSKEVFDAVILTEDERVADQIRLAGARASAVYKGKGTIKIKPWHVAEALALDERRVKEAFKEIKSVYAGVLKEWN